MPNRLKELRTNKKMKQTELASYLKVAQSTLSGWENNKFEIDNENLFMLCELFQVSSDYLLGRTDDPTPSRPAREPQITGAAAHLPEGLPQEAVEEYRQMLEFLKFKYGKQE